MLKRLQDLLRSEDGVAALITALAVFILLLMLSGHSVVVQ